ncbi:hypothetical protein Y032_0003g1565 [Ancylostoma ceylanicum]|uniref:Uncharacterized protein n=1 Tax=Ancylostoma ceylanicum TaxID=53326 RepID=A0A016W081_9BILA|nr:hypothetical protein Y032_0003g1565 [Ancylostoma ceylanicum]
MCSLSILPPTPQLRAGAAFKMHQLEGVSIFVLTKREDVDKKKKKNKNELSTLSTMKKSSFDLCGVNLLYHLIKLHLVTNAGSNDRRMSYMAPTVILSNTDELDADI